MRILVRATNWVGDAVMSLPALQALRGAYPEAHIAIQARPWVADLYAREPFCDEIILHTADRGSKDWAGKWRLARELRAKQFDWALLLQNAFEAALIVRLAGIPRRTGYDRDGRGWLLTERIAVPRKEDIPRHQRFYYLELLRRAGVLNAMPESDAIRLAGAPQARAAGLQRLREAGFEEPVIGLSPGAAYGNAKRWLPESFAEAGASLARKRSSAVALFGSEGERALCEAVRTGIAAQGITAINFAGKTTLAEFIECAAACEAFLTNDSGSMHVASALGVPTVAIFGATDAVATGPTGPLARVVQEEVECSPCLLRECPIDHRCMTRVSPERVTETALALLR